MLRQIVAAAAAASTPREDPVPWDDYFMSIAFLASMRSPCHRLRVGSVIVKDNRIIAMGYNGFIAGAPHVSRMRDNHEQAIIHSEINAVRAPGRQPARRRHLRHALPLHQLLPDAGGVRHQARVLLLRLQQRPACSRVSRRRRHRHPLPQRRMKTRVKNRCKIKLK